MWYLSMYLCLSLFVYIYIYVYLYIFLRFSTSIVVGTKLMLHFGYGPTAPTKESACSKTWETQVWDGSSNERNLKHSASRPHSSKKPRRSSPKLSWQMCCVVVMNPSNYHSWNSTGPRSCSAAEISRPDRWTVNRFRFVQEPRTWSINIQYIT